MLQNIWDEKKQKIGIIMASTFVFGMIAHGYMLANKISYHDDIYNLFYVGGTYGMGRWMLGIIGKICSMLGGNYSLSWWNGLASFFFLGIICFFLTEILQLKKKSSLVFSAGILVVFPVIAGLFGYMFTSFPYMIGLCMGTIGVYLITGCNNQKSVRRQNVLKVILGIFLLCCCVGVYQPYFGFCLCLLLMELIKRSIGDDAVETKNIWKRGFWYVGTAILALAAYLVANKFFLFLVKKEMYHYDGVENMGIVSIGTYCKRIGIAYREFLMPARETVYDMYPMVMHGVYWLLLLAGVIFAVKNLLKMWKKSVQKAITCGLLFLLLPLGINFIFVLADVESIYTLTMYGQVLQFVFVLALSELEQTAAEQKRWSRSIAVAGELLILFSIIWYTRFDNMCYFKADLLQERAKSYYTQLITRIQQVDGYDETLPVAFVNPLEKQIPNMTMDEELAEIKMMPYQDNTIINNYVWDMFMAEWCGYEPTIYDGDYVTKWIDVSDMPHYPEEGSIEIRQDIIIVKF